MTDEQKVLLKRKGNEPIVPNVFFGGLSKREFYTSVALNSINVMEFQSQFSTPVDETVAKLCVGIADAIIKELNK
jgi:hypothetical protein